MLCVSRPLDCGDGLFYPGIHIHVSWKTDFLHELDFSSSMCDGYSCMFILRCNGMWSLKVSRVEYTFFGFMHDNFFSFSEKSNVGYGKDMCLIAAKCCCFFLQCYCYVNGLQLMEFGVALYFELLKFVAAHFVVKFQNIVS